MGHPQVIFQVEVVIFCELLLGYEEGCEPCITLLMFMAIFRLNMVPLCDHTKYTSELTLTGLNRPACLQDCQKFLCSCFECFANPTSS